MGVAGIGGAGEETYEGGVHDEHDGAEAPVVDKRNAQGQDHKREDEADRVQTQLRHDPLLRLDDRRGLDDLRAVRDLLLHRRPSRVLLVGLELLAVRGGILDELRGSGRELGTTRSVGGRSCCCRSRSGRSPHCCGWSLGRHDSDMIRCPSM